MERNGTLRPFPKNVSLSRDKRCASNCPPSNDDQRLQSVSNWVRIPYAVVGWDVGQNAVPWCGHIVMSGHCLYFGNLTNNIYTKQCDVIHGLPCCADAAAGAVDPCTTFGLCSAVKEILWDSLSHSAFIFLTTCQRQWINILKWLGPCVESRRIRREWLSFYIRNWHFWSDRLLVDLALLIVSFLLFYRW